MRYITWKTHGSASPFMGMATLQAADFSKQKDYQPAVGFETMQSFSMRPKYAPASQTGMHDPRDKTCHSPSYEKHS